MWVSPEVRGRRAAGSLCDAYGAWARAGDLGELTLTVVIGNEQARRAYQAAGFAISVKTTWSRDGRTLGVFVMSRSVKAQRSFRMHPGEVMLAATARPSGVRRDLDGRSFYACAIDALLASDSSLIDLVEAVRALPYGRPGDRTVEGMLRERCGTCSTKHLFLARALAERFPETKPLIVHRVYTLDRARAQELFGTVVAEVVPEGGLVDVHRYLTIVVEGRRMTVDATFPGTAWDGHSSLPLACGPGRDYPAGENPDAEKRALESQHCDPVIREPFIAALTLSHAEPARSRGRRSSHRL
jgi:hypothetical protein